MKLAACACVVVAMCGSVHGQARMRATGVVDLPAGTVELRESIRVPANAKALVIRGATGGTTLRAGPGFNGKALLVVSGGAGVTIENLAIDGNRKSLGRAVDLPNFGTTFFDHYSGIGIAAERVDGLTIRNVRIAEVANYAVLVRRSARVVIERIEVRDSGGVDTKGFNNASGGVLFEDGTREFSIRNSRFENVLGNGIWTHSRADAPVNRDGVIEGNVLKEIGRDAIQVGQASNVRVVGNRGSRIGYPAKFVDAASWAVPVALDTAGDVDASVYEGNVFEEINGKCIDLDGFHHGVVRRNRCTNSKTMSAYPHAHFGVVFNNTNPFQAPDGIQLVENVISGMKYGGIFVIGRGHRIAGNELINVNMAGCPESHAAAGCYWVADEPDMLMSGIYLGKSPMEHTAAPAVGNVVENNRISGKGMSMRCVVTAPGNAAGANVVRGNRCEESAAGAVEK